MLVEAVLYIQIEALVEAVEVEKLVQKILKNFSKFLKNKDHTIKGSFVLWIYERSPQAGVSSSEILGPLETWTLSSRPGCPPSRPSRPGLLSIFMKQFMKHTIVIRCRM
ncbi:hypothetical protein L1887_08176 [Cichorium endivia]|nr:hypothetical protein L1887_08176 [Cichorium endivia]